MVRISLIRLLGPLAVCAAVWSVFATDVVAQDALSTSGASEALREELANASLVLQARRDGEKDPSAILAAAQADYERLLAVLYENGHFGGAISVRINGREAADFSALSRIGPIAAISVQVNPGPVYRFGQAQVVPLPPGSTVVPAFRRGAVASTSVIRDAAAESVTVWRAEGFGKARIADQRIVARHSDDRVDAALRVDTGPRLTFGTVSVKGNQNVRTRRILKIAGLTEGRRFDPEEVARAETRLRRTGSFNSVAVEEAQFIGPDNTLPLTIGVAEATPRRFGFGAEYSTTDGVRLSGFWLHRNFLGGAERFRVDGAISGIAGETGGTDLSFGVRYERPATPRADTDFFAEYTFDALDEPSFSSDTSEFSVGFKRYASDRTTVSLGFGYLYSETTDALGSEIVELIPVTLGATHDRRDNALDPKTGIYADATITPFLGLAGTSDGAQITLDLRAYRSSAAVTFAGRAQLGALFGPSLETSPAFYRFFSGGGGTVRGQDFQSLGIDTGGALIGGRSSLVLSGEVRADLNEDFQIVGFVDWGYVGSESFPDFSGESHAGAGLGVRYKTGIGPIRLDVATPVSGDTEASDFYLYVGIGQAF